MTALSISIPFGEGDLRGHGNLAFAPVNRHNSTSKVARFSVDFDALRKELLLYLKNIKKCKHWQYNTIQIHTLPEKAEQ